MSSTAIRNWHLAVSTVKCKIFSVKVLILLHMVGIDRWQMYENSLRVLHLLIQHLWSNDIYIRKIRIANTLDNYNYLTLEMCQSTQMVRLHRILACSILLRRIPRGWFLIHTGFVIYLCRSDDFSRKSLSCNQITNPHVYKKFLYCWGRVQKELVCVYFAAVWFLLFSIHDLSFFFSSILSPKSCLSE